MDTPEDLLAGRQRLAIFTEPVPEEAFLPQSGDLRARHGLDLG